MQYISDIRFKSVNTQFKYYKYILKKLQFWPILVFYIKQKYPDENYIHVIKSAINSNNAAFLMDSLIYRMYSQDRFFRYIGGMLSSMDDQLRHLVDHEDIFKNAVEFWKQTDETSPNKTRVETSNQETESVI